MSVEKNYGALKKKTVVVDEEEKVQKRFDEIASMAKNILIGIFLLKEFLL